MRHKNKVLAATVLLGVPAALWMLSPHAGRGSPRIARVTAAPGAVFAPLPAINTPMRLAYRQIKEQADAGDAVAQCRLAAEIDRCGKRLPQLLESGKDADARYSKVPRGAEALALLRQSIAKDIAVCRDFTPDPDDRPWRLLLQSALNGNRTAALEYTMGGGLDSTRFLADLEGWAAYKQYAPQLLQQAIASGDPRAYEVATFHGQLDLYGAQLVPRDPVQLAAYDIAATTLATPEYRAQLQKQVDALHLSDAQLAQAQLRASRPAITASMCLRLSCLEGAMSL